MLKLMIWGLYPIHAKQVRIGETYLQNSCWPDVLRLDKMQQIVRSGKRTALEPFVEGSCPENGRVEAESMRQREPFRSQVINSALRMEDRRREAIGFETSDKRRIQSLSTTFKE